MIYLKKLFIIFGDRFSSSKLLFSRIDNRADSFPVCTRHLHILSKKFFNVQASPAKWTGEPSRTPQWSIPSWIHSFIGSSSIKQAPLIMRSHDRQCIPECTLCTRGLFQTGYQHFPIQWKPYSKGRLHFLFSQTAINTNNFQRYSPYLVTHIISKPP